MKCKPLNFEDGDTQKSPQLSFLTFQKESDSIEETQATARYGHDASSFLWSVRPDPRMSHEI
jgi:hypothetical protein